MLFGPAYKGIPLATALACEYARRGRDLPLAFNRKEAKAHGEGGTADRRAAGGQRVLIVDDVITAGTAIREALGDHPRRRRHARPACDRARPPGARPGRAHARRRRRLWPPNSACRWSPSPAWPTCLRSPAKAPELVDHRDALLAYRARYGSATAP